MHCLYLAHSASRQAPTEYEVPGTIYKNELKYTLFTAFTYNLEGIPGIYEQLTPLQFHFIEKPAQILQIPSPKNIVCFEFTQPL